MLQTSSCDADSVQSVRDIFTVTMRDFHPAFRSDQIFTLEGIPLLMHTSDFQHSLWSSHSVTTMHVGQLLLAALKLSK